MRYLVRAKVKAGQEAALLRAIDDGTLGQGSVAGDEYMHNMREATLLDEATAQWVEVCFCAIPLEEERPYWEKYFDLLRVQDAHSRTNCRDLNGTEPWACCDCDCTRQLENHLRAKGTSFLSNLRRPCAEKAS
jgi:hypothetical protein